jgi:hypothetical protein
MNKKDIDGFWLLEPDFPVVIQELLSNPRCNELGLGILRFIASEMSKVLALSSDQIRVTAIVANYHGAYPCLAVQGDSERMTDELGKRLCKEAIRMLSEPHYSEFAAAVLKELN